jgi:hypothetical protein
MDSIPILEPFQNIQPLAVLPVQQTLMKSAAASYPK